MTGIGFVLVTTFLASTVESIEIVNLSVAALLLALVTSATFIATRRLPFDHAPDQLRGVEQRFHDRRAGKAGPHR
jgi:hypothetical protein